MKKNKIVDYINFGELIVGVAPDQNGKMRVTSNGEKAVKDAVDKMFAMRKKENNSKTKNEKG